LKEQNTLSYGKFFASYNRTGNVTLDPYSLNNAYSQINGFPFGNLVGFTPSSRYPNPNIQPEFVKSIEVGAQLAFSIIVLMLKEVIFILIQEDKSLMLPLLGLQAIAVRS